MGAEEPSAVAHPDGGMGVRAVLAILGALLGGGLIVAGVAVVYWPAGLIVAGVLLLTALFGPNVE